nr:hypothetical protein GCM10020092_095040 [Actinoplanes digitatis]
METAVHPSPVRRALASIVLLAAVAATAAPPSAQAALAAADTAVDVDVRAGLATVPGTALGLNHAIWDAELGTTAVSGLLKDAGVEMLRYPGGSYADIYHWRDHTAPGGYVAPNTDFDTFMAGAKRTGAQPMIIANYGTGTAQEAADWVRYANVTKGYGATYWTIGNENYGNGHYGAAWEADDHADKSPKEYAANVVAYAAAMKAVDPSIKVGAVLTMPGNWPDGIVGTGDQGTWNAEVLTRAGASIDFVDVHWYPGGGTAAESLTRTEHIEDAVYLLRGQLARYAGANADRIGISMTETNVGVGQNTQPGALFLADVYSGLLEQGVFTVQWWNTHNGIGTVSTVAGQRDYGDFGLLSSGGCTSDGSVCEPPMNTPFAPYHALKLMGSFARAGDQLVRGGANNPLVSAHASRLAQRRPGRPAGQQGPGQRAHGRPALPRLDAGRGCADGVDVHQRRGRGADRTGGHGDRPDAPGVLAHAPDPAPGQHRRGRAEGAGPSGGRARSPTGPRPSPGPPRRPAGPSDRQVRALPAERRRRRAARRDDRHVVHRAEPGTGPPVHGERAGPRHRGWHVLVLAPADVHHHRPGGGGLHGTADRHQRLGQRVRRADRHHEQLGRPPSAAGPWPSPGRPSGRACPADGAPPGNRPVQRSG